MAMVEDGDISAGHARALLAIKDEADQLSIATKVVSESLSVRQTENLAAKVAALSSKKEKYQEDKITIKINYLADTERQLEAALGRKVIIKDNSKRGIIELEYYGNNDREALIDALLNFGSSKGGRVQ